MEEKKAAFIGAGMIGAGLAVNTMLAGYEVWIQDVCPLDLVKDRIENILRLLEKNEVCTRAEAKDALERTVFTNSIEDAATNAYFIQEACPDSLEIKQSVYAEMERWCPEEAVISSTSTTLMPSDLQAKAVHPERLLIGHPFHPSYLLPLIEVCPGKQTSEAAVSRAMAFFQDIGKYPVRCRKEVKGAIVNRLCWGINNAAKEAVADGVCTPEELDRAFMYGPGIRMAITGLLLTMDLGVAGGMRKMAEKYGGVATPADLLLADGIDSEIANRSEREGQTREAVDAYRDEMIAHILRLQGML